MQPIGVFISREGGEVAALQELVDGDVTELDWIGLDEFGSEVQVRLVLAAVSEDEEG